LGKKCLKVLHVSPKLKVVYSMIQRVCRISLTVLLLFTALFLSSCNRTLGYGVLFWASDSPQIPSGTVLRVYIRSNINRSWVVGVPREMRGEEIAMNRFEVPLAHLELVGSRRRALERAYVFAPYALMYAETLQDRLPIRENPDNVSRLVYRLREGEIIKILGPVTGQAVIGATGQPLPGQWYRVLTQGGTVGFTFSYRLRLFEYTGGHLASFVAGHAEDVVDAGLEMVLNRVWSPEIYAVMLNTRQIELDDLRQHWNFDPGQDTGVARIRLRGIDLSFPYTNIRATGTNTWRFEGSTLQMSLRNPNTLAVQFNEPGGMLQTHIFVALPTHVDNIIHQETVRREALFREIFEHGPEFFSNNFGTLTFHENGRFTWTGNALLVPQTIPVSALGSGTTDMRLSLNAAMSQHYSGAFTLFFDGVGGARFPVNFMYTLDMHGLRIEHAPMTSMDGLSVVRRASSPVMANFFRIERQETTAPAPLGSQDIWDDLDIWDIPDAQDFDVFSFLDLFDDGDAQDVLH